MDSGIYCKGITPSNPPDCCWLGRRSSAAAGGSCLVLTAVDWPPAPSMQVDVVTNQPVIELIQSSKKGVRSLFSMLNEASSAKHEVKDEVAKLDRSFSHTHSTHAHTFSVPPLLTRPVDAAPARPSSTTSMPRLERAEPRRLPNLERPPPPPPPRQPRQPPRQLHPHLMPSSRWRGSFV